MAEACGKVCYKSELLSAFYDRSLWHSLLQIRAVKCFWIFIPMLENSCKHLIEVRLIFFFFFPPLDNSLRKEKADSETRKATST